MKTRIVLFVLASVLTVSAAFAQPDEGQSRDVDTPSVAVEGTHDCTGYYPQAAQRLGHKGDVQVRYDVGPDGAISNVTLVKSSGYTELDAAAVACVEEHWRNTPATRNGVAVASPGHDALVRFLLPPSLMDIVNALDGGDAFRLILIGAAIIAAVGGLAWLLGRRSGAT